jgi:hypothetical protein
LEKNPEFLSAQLAWKMQTEDSFFFPGDTALHLSKLGSSQLGQRFAAYALTRTLTAEQKSAIPKQTAFSDKFLSPIDKSLRKYFHLDSLAASIAWVRFRNVENS